MHLGSRKQWQQRLGLLARRLLRNRKRRCSGKRGSSEDPLATTAWPGSSRQKTNTHLVQPPLTGALGRASNGQNPRVRRTARGTGHMFLVGVAKDSRAFCVEGGRHLIESRSHLLGCRHAPATE